jgi:predicted aconitase with swiveling domain
MKLSGRRISAGRAQGTGLVSSSPISFLGDVDPNSGLISDPESGIFGESVLGRVLVFPFGRGSTVGSYVIYSSMKNLRAPSAIVNERAEAIVATGAVISSIPMIDGIDIGLLRTGDRMVVDADSGSLEMPDVHRQAAVTSFLLNRDKVLILKRSDKVGTHKGKWAGVSGYLEDDESPEDRSKQEILEETGIANPLLLRSGEPVLARGDDTVWEIHPFLYKVDTRDVAIDWEHVEYKWVSPEDVTDYGSVSRLKRVLDSVLLDPHRGRQETVA